MIDRRHFLIAGTAGAVAACVPLTDDLSSRIAARLRIVEASSGGTLGAAFHDTGSGLTYGYAGYARYPMCSTFKMSLAARVLWGEQQGELDMTEQMRWTQGDLLSYAPFARERLAQGATLAELAQAAQVLSDNTAANLLLRKIGGPQRLTAFWRDLGDPVSRLDRTEPELNNVPPGEIMDTTTPQAMAQTVAALLYGSQLDSVSRSKLKGWMAMTQTGKARVRAGLPASWRTGDKTGTSLAPGMGSVYGDIGFAEPPGRAPITFAAYFRSARQQNEVSPESEAVLAEIGRVLAGLVTAQS